MLAVRSRPVANRLYAALSAFLDMAESGELPESLRWLTRSRLIFLRKKNSAKPRPIRVGEVLRRCAAKRLAHDHRAELRRFFLKHGQYGVSIPGGADALVQFRMEMEAHLRELDVPMVALDLDLVNAFPRFTWEAIRSSVGQHAPGLAPWTSWCHRQAAEVVLPCGEVVRVDRGAEQGDPLGPAFCGLVLADAMAAARVRLGPMAAHIHDVWFMDDGQVFMHPLLVDPFLQALDLELARIGATRGTGPEVKSVARLFGPSLSENEQEDWATEHVRASCKVPDKEEPLEVLGINIGTAPEAQLSEAVRKMESIHEALSLVEDCGVELSLARHCADVCRLVHLLRARGSDLSGCSLRTADDTVMAMLQRILGSPIPSHSALQASLATTAGGLGLRRATDLAAPAYVAARVDARPFVEALLSAVPVAWVRHTTGLSEQAARRAEAARLLEAYDARTAAGAAQLREVLTPAGADHLDQVLAEGAVLATERVSKLVRPHNLSPEAFAAESALPIIDEAGPVRCAAQEEEGGLQSRLCKLVDDRQFDALVTHLKVTEDWEGQRRLRELRHPDCDHHWLQALCPAHGACLSSAEYADGLRIRLGLDFVSSTVPCAACEHGMLQTNCAHALCCAPGECTRGHNAVRDDLLDLASLADPSALLELLGVIPSVPNVRPADILCTAAIPGCTTALDVGIASPDAIGAGPDCCEAVFKRKVATYASHEQELAARGVRYLPFAISCYGRLHPEAIIVVSRLAAAAARRHSALGARALEKRVRCRISVRVARRAVSMLRACLPPLPAESAAVLLGPDPAGEDCSAGAPAVAAASLLCRRGPAALAA